MYKNYTTPTDTLELNFTLTVPKNHIARFINQFVDSIPDSIIFPNTTSKMGRPAHHPRMLLKMILFAYTRSTYSGRKIVQLNEENIPMQWLSQQTYVCYHVINNFRSNKEFSSIIKNIFVYFTLLLQHYHIIDSDSLFIDGTKVQADANRYSFVWRKAVERYDEALNEKISTLYDQLIQNQVNVALSEEEKITEYGVNAMIEATNESLNQLEELIQEEPNHIVGGSKNKQKRRLLNSFKRQLEKDFLPRKEKYTKAMETFDNRNSYSKTDNDATFMCMKEDAMKNRELKPGYNLQIATNHQYVLGFDVFPNPTDMRTLKPFLESFKLLENFSTIVADAGYGSEENYQLILEEYEKTPLIPYTMYEKEQTKKFKNNPANRQNWQYIEKEDYYIDHLGVKFSFKYYSTRNDKNGFTRQFKVYEADSIQETKALDELAKTPAGQLRQIRVNQVWETYKETVKEALHSDRGRSIYAQRKIEVEPVFGQMKRNFGMRRTHVRGKIAVHNDLGLIFLGMNLQRLMKYILNNMNQGWFIPLDFTDLTKECHLNSIFLQILIEKHVLILIVAKSGRAFFYF
ncbi:IS1182 family transposase [uncultured Granulicatella sp.]|uniref:IS1182 family transposase n=1 Tax=uncultured Granulicatella sp. TaxID=316089 RepID=UPI0028F155FF|nr:IS1182 family transposase [uncultured Granulicatella sp.]